MKKLSVKAWRYNTKLKYYIIWRYNTKWRYYISMVKDKNFECHFVVYATLYNEE